MKWSHVSMALAGAVALGGSALAAATVTQFSVKDTSLQGTFVCTNDPLGVTTTIRLISASTVQQEPGTKETTSFTSIGIVRTDGSDTPIFDAGGYSTTIAPQIASNLSSGSVAGTLIVTDVQAGLDIHDASFTFSFTAQQGSRALEGPMQSNEDFGSYRQIAHFKGVQQSASGTGTITVADPSTGAILLTCPVRSIDDPDFPTVIARISAGTLTVIPKEQ